MPSTPTGTNPQRFLSISSYLGAAVSLAGGSVTPGLETLKDRCQSRANMQENEGRKHEKETVSHGGTYLGRKGIHEGLIAWDTVNHQGTSPFSQVTGTCSGEERQKTGFSRSR